MRLRELRKLVEQILAGGGGFSLGEKTDRTSELGQSQNPLTPLDPTKVALVEVLFQLDEAGSGVWIPVLDDESVQIKQMSLNNPGGTVAMSGSLSVFVPPGATYSVNASFQAPGNEYNMGATGVNVYALNETPIG